MPQAAKSVKTKNFPSYAELIKGLLSGVGAVGFFRPDGKCEWISNPKAVPNLGLVARETLRVGRGSRNIEDDEIVSFALPLRARSDILGVIALTLSTGDSDNWDTTLDRIETALKPVLTVLANELASRLPEPKSNVLTERTEELEWLFSITAELRPGASDSAAVEQLLSAAVERMGACFGGLALPEKRVDVTYTSRTHSDPAAAVAYQQAYPHLMNFVQRQHKPIVINSPPAGRADLSRHKILAIPVTAKTGKVAGIMAFFRSSTESGFGRREQYLGRHIARQVGALLDSQFDLATGLYTRIAFEQQVNQGLDNGKGTVHSLAFIDIDELHVVNEAFGYDAGDEFIVRFSELLQPPLLPSDAIASRTAGDRFLVFLPGHDASRTEACVSRLQKEAAQIGFGSGAQRIALSFSCGISRLMKVDQSVGRGIAAAELACKTAKERGRGRSEIYLDVDESMMRRRSDVVGLGRLRDALRNGRLTMFGQIIAPIGDVSQAAGIECLVRMVAPDGSIVPPGEFMSVAQRHQLLKKIDEWVIQNTLTILAPFAVSMLHSGLYASINISGQSLGDEDLLGRIGGWIRDSKVPPGRIMFEITESAAVSNLAKADKLMRNLRRMGCRFALDDFGTGVNSLSYLKTLQVQAVKIDGSFVRDIQTNARSAAMVEAIMKLTKSLQISCVAEFVESEAIIRKLEKLGVEFVQGYYIQKPADLRAVFESVGNSMSQRRRRLSMGE